MSSSNDIYDIDCQRFSAEVFMKEISHYNKFIFRPHSLPRAQPSISSFSPRKMTSPLMPPQIRGMPNAWRDALTRMIRQTEVITLLHYITMSTLTPSARHQNSIDCLNRPECRPERKPHAFFLITAHLAMAVDFAFPPQQTPPSMIAAEIFRGTPRF